MSYNSKVVHKVLDDFENKYKMAAANADKRKKELYKKIPELWDIDSRLSGTYVELAEIMLNSSDNASSKLIDAKKKNQDLLKKRKFLLENSGYSANYTDPVYDCQICGDSGYINRGEDMCDCMKKALAAESINYSGLGRTIKDQTFDNFNLNYYDKKKSSDKLINESPYKYMKSIYEDCKKFACNFGGEYSDEPGEIKRNLLLMGTTGVGKTHLSSAIAYEVIKKGFDVFYDSAQSILYSFEKERFSRFGTFDPDIIERYMTCDLLIIDDLGTEYSGNMSVSSLYNLINMRLLDNKSMIISTNLTGEEMQKRYDDRIVSRMFGMFTTLNFIGEDIRFRKV